MRSAEIKIDCIPSGILDDEIEVVVDLLRSAINIALDSTGGAQVMRSLLLSASSSLYLFDISSLRSLDPNNFHAAEIIIRLRYKGIQPQNIFQNGDALFDYLEKIHEEY